MEIFSPVRIFLSYTPPFQNPAHAPAYSILEEVVKLKAWENTTVTYINMILKYLGPKLSSGHKSEGRIIMVQKNVCIP